MDCNPRNVLHAKPGTQNSSAAANNQESVGVPLLVALVKEEMKATSQRSLKAENLRWPWKRVFLGAFANSRGVTANSPHETNRPSMNRVMIFHIWVFFSKISRETPRRFKTGQRQQVFYMKSCVLYCTVHLWYLAEFFTEFEVFQINVEKIKTHIFGNFLSKIVTLW